ncbi:hypothetical protein [Pelagibaculum spongiae]|uniref:Uncharacterized protein n=1 Tax=Pelagibaculum spongiae TaxID=2080658 RepID=A0A2V1H0F5_9GAMM|nr:hypothetical protein [Pelagibaculum spongiae]PVZ68150.1 hypothetical protein DC094_12660 [Pelagibaculum spongiae]
MKIIYFDIDETLITADNRLKYLSQFQMLKTTPCRSLFNKRQFHFLHYQLHRAFFEEFNDKNPPNAMLCLATNATYPKDDMLHFFAQCFPAAAHFFYTKMMYLYLYSFSSDEDSAFTIMNHCFHDTTFPREQLLLPFDSITKTARILQHSQIARAECKEEEVELYLIDDNVNTLKAAYDKKIVCLKSSIENYEENLIEIGNRIGLDVKERILKNSLESTDSANPS